MGMVLKILGVVFLAVILVGVGVAGAIYFLAPKINPTGTSSNPITQITNQVAQVQGKKLFSGQVKQLGDLGLVLISEDEKLNNYVAKVFYYSAGTFETGDLAGYTRVILIREATSPAGPSRIVFATKDFKTYIIDSDDKIAEGDFLSFDNSKVTSSQKIPSEHQMIMTIDDRFSLNRNSILTESRSTGTKDKYGNDVTEEVLQTDFYSYTSLKSGDDNFKMYSVPRVSQKFPSTSTPELLADEALRQKYLASDTSVVVVDSTGLPYRYDMTNKTGLMAYPQAYANAQKLLQDYVDKKIKDYPTFPQKPGLRFKSFEASLSVPGYSDYDIAVPSACAFNVTTWVLRNVNDTDFKKVGTSPDGDIYALTDSNHDLLKMEFKTKVSNTPDDSWAYTKNPPKPTFSDYVAKNPLLFFKDFWGRWIAVGEYDYKLMGGCGKPVVYLYPDKETEVTVNFLSRMQLTTTIPTYNNGWDVLARPDGTLSELGQRTDCSSIVSKFGSEYASQACKDNLYPYLYWAGNSLERTYPQPQGGWFVTSDQLNAFLSSKLDEVGLTVKEKADMLSFWIPEMLKSGSPYYRISFLQTAEMNQIAPMLILPKPQSLYRIFLDFVPLTDKPTEEIAPQSLEHISRNGFTVLEWGGKLVQ